MLKIEIKTGNAAFCNPETGEEDMFYEGCELSRILRQIADRIENGATDGSCIDINGNKVGHWSRLEGKNMPTLKEMLLKSGYPESEMDHHESDLYVYVTPLTTQVIDYWCNANGYRREWQCPTFIDQITGRMMYDCAFQWHK